MEARAKRQRIVIWVILVVLVVSVVSVVLIVSQLPQRKNGKLSFISKSQKIDTIIDLFLNYHAFRLVPERMNFARIAHKLNKCWKTAVCRKIIFSANQSMQCRHYFLVTIILVFVSGMPRQAVLQRVLQRVLQPVLQRVFQPGLHQNIKVLCEMILNKFH